MPPRHLALLLAVVGVVVLAVGCGERAGNEGNVVVEPGVSQLDASDGPPALSDGVQGAQRSLEKFRAALADPNTTNDWFRGELMITRMRHQLPPPPPGTPWFTPTPPGPEEEEQHYKQILRHFRERESEWPDEYRAEVREYRKSIEKLWLQAFTLEKIDRETGTNARAAVNLAIAHLLSNARSPGFSKDIIEALEKTIFKARYEVSPQLYDSAFFALAWLRDQESLVWMVREFIHTNKSPRRKVDQLNAAHKAMVLFDRDKVDGRLRYKLVSRMVRTYAGAEARGQPPNEWYAQVFWERIGCDAIRATQYFAGDPKDEDGQPLDTMEELAEWFRTHKNPSKPPWTDE